MRFCVLELLFFVYVGVFVRHCTASSWLMDPPSRSASWYYGIRAPVNYNFRNINCGGQPVSIQSDGSRNCGLCGDPISEAPPRANENGGIYALDVILTRFYEEGDEIEFSVWNNVPKTPGFYEFRLCEDGGNPSQSCLDQNLLFLPEVGDYRMTVPTTPGLILIKAQLPSGVTCDHCLVQWRFRRGDTSGCDQNQWCGLGRGPQVEYYNCADVMIGAQGSVKPDYIQDPVYTSEDYGSAYDTGNIGSATTPSSAITNQVVTLTTNTGTTVSTATVPIQSATTARILTIPTGQTNPTTDPNLTTPDPGDRLVIADVGSAGTSVIAIEQNRRPSNLALLLALIPLIGAASLRGSTGAAVPQPASAALVPQFPSGPVWGRLGPVGDFGISQTTNTGGVFGFGSSITNSGYPWTNDIYIPVGLPYRTGTPNVGGLNPNPSITGTSNIFTGNTGNTEQSPATNNFLSPPGTIPQRSLVVEQGISRTYIKQSDAGLSAMLDQKGPAPRSEFSWTTFNSNKNFTLPSNNPPFQTTQDSKQTSTQDRNTGTRFQHGYSAQYLQSTFQKQQSGAAFNQQINGIPNVQSGDTPGVNNQIHWNYDQQPGPFFSASMFTPSHAHPSKRPIHRPFFQSSGNPLRQPTPAKFQNLGSVAQRFVPRLQPYNSDIPQSLQQWPKGIQTPGNPRSQLSNFRFLSSKRR